MKAEDVLSLCTRLRAFVSIDIINSTRIKQIDEKNPSAKWVQSFIDFFTYTNWLVRAEWKRVALEKDVISEVLDPPEFWRTRGDEIIFTKVLPPHSQTFTLVYLLKILRDIPEKIRFDLPLDVKITVWLAGFPINNFEVLTQDSLDSGANDGQPQPANLNLIKIAEKRHNGNNIPVKELDFLGPQIDLGFRLCEFSSRRKMVVSADIAYMCSVLEENNIQDKLDRCGIDIDSFLLFHFQEFRSLKGIQNGEEYPIFWMDVESDEDKVKLYIERDEIEGNEPFKAQDLRGLLLKFLDDSSSVRMRPYAISEHTNIPERTSLKWHQDHRDKLLEGLRIELDNFSELDPSLEKGENNQDQVEYLIRQFFGSREADSQ